MKIISFTRRIIRGLGLSAAALLSLAAAAQAEMSDWVDNEGGRMRLIALPPERDGTIHGGLQIEPKPGWITYWREPGSSGIPPQITVAPESGVTLKEIRYPVPKHIKDGKVDDIGYDAPVVLPLTFKADGDGAPGAINATAFIGICKELCVPFQAAFELPLSSARQSRPEEEALLEQAEKALPEEASSGFQVVSHKMSADMKELWLEIALPGGGDTAPQVIVTGPNGYVFTKQLMSKRDGKTFSTSVAIGKLPRNYALKGKTWHALVIDGGRAMETPLAFE